MQKISVDLGLGEDAPMFFCPFNGVNILDEACLESEMNNVVALVHWEIIEAPIYMAEEFEAVLSELMETEEDFEEFIEAKYSDDDDILIFHITYGGMACGPVYETVTVIYRV